MTQRICSFKPCGRDARAQGLCEGHYRQRLRGNALKQLQEDVPNIKRFEKKVDYNGPMNPLTGTRCHIWTASRWLPTGMVEKLGRKTARPGEDGYGKYGQGSKTLLAHRVAWELYVGPIPDGHEIDHDNEQVGCRVKACVNVEHLRPTLTNKRRRKTNTSGEPGIRWNTQAKRWKVTVQGTLNGITKPYSPAAIGLPSIYRGTPDVIPQEAIDARDKLYAALGQLPAGS